jgi:tyrosyl-tRNA synthetase
MSTKHDINYVLKRAVAEIIVRQELEALLASGKILRLKEGFDPSSPDIHLGHMVPLRKLRQFQELGHQVVLIVGDWTAQIGDPSGASVTRPMLSAEQVKANAETYMQQFFKIVDRKKTEVRWQSEWYGKFTLADVIRLAGKFTIAQLLAREDFSTRYNAGRPITMAELLYPLLQAYDSVMVEADVEFGDTAQKFNILLGRELQSMVGQHRQQVFLVPTLIGTDGVQKMSKSLGNYIGVAEPPNDIYGKVMSITDDLIMNYFELLTDVPDKELEELRQTLSQETINPMELKKRLAREIILQLYSEKDAIQAGEHFLKVVQRRELPKDIEERAIPFSKFTEPSRDWTASSPAQLNVGRLLVETQLTHSRTEAERLITQKAVEIDGKTVESYAAPVRSGSIIKVGKRRFVKVVNSDKPESQ